MFVNGISQLPSAMHMLAITVPPLSYGAGEQGPCSCSSVTSLLPTILLQSLGRAMFVFHLQSAEVGLPVLMRELTPGPFFMQGGLKTPLDFSMTTEIVLFAPYPWYWEQCHSHSRHPKICVCVGWRGDGIAEQI